MIFDTVYSYPISMHAEMKIQICMYCYLSVIAYKFQNNQQDLLYVSIQICLGSHKKPGGEPFCAVSPLYPG